MTHVIPADAGIQSAKRCRVRQSLDRRVRGDDVTAPMTARYVYFPNFFLSASTLPAMMSPLLNDGVKAA